jgi:selenocysteine lyase/cysteine desulfurase
MTFNREMVKKIRAEFPRAEFDARGRKRIFFDNGAGTLVLRRAAQAEAKARIDCSANLGSVFNESKMAEATILEGRKAVADLLNAPSPETIVSGESATHLLFGLSYALGKELTGKENIVTTDYEHYSNISPWIELNRRDLIKEVRFTRLNKEEGTLDMDHLGELVDHNTKIVTVSAASNVLGTKSPLLEIGKIAKEVDAYFVVDAVHHIPHGSVDVQDIGCDFLVFSGYKFFSSHGSFLYGKKELLEKLKPYKVAPAPQYPPNKWEWGTRNQAMFAAIKGVIDHLVWLADQVVEHYKSLFTNYSGRVRSLKVAMDAIDKYGQKLSKVMLTGSDDIIGLSEMSHVKLFGLKDINNLEERDPTFSFKVQNVSDEELAERLWTKYGIAFLVEDFYSKVPEVYGVSTMMRTSFVHYNTAEEICILLKALNELANSK